MSRKGRLWLKSFGQDLEKEFERKLHGSWTALLVLRTYSSQTLVQHLRRLPERRRSERRIDVSKIRVIEQIERLSAELERETFIQRDVPAYREIYLGLPKTTRKVSRSIPWVSSRWNHKGGR